MKDDELPPLVLVTEAEAQFRRGLQAERAERFLAKAHSSEPVLTPDPSLAKQRRAIRAREKAASDRARMRVLRTVARHRYRRVPRSTSVPRGRTRCARPREMHSARSSKSGRGSPDSELPPEQPAAYWRRLEIIAAEVQAWFRRQAGVVA